MLILNIINLTEKVVFLINEDDFWIHHFLSPLLQMLLQVVHGCLATRQKWPKLPYLAR